MSMKAFAPKLTMTMFSLFICCVLKIFVYLEPSSAFLLPQTLPNSRQLLPYNIQGRSKHLTSHKAEEGNFKGLRNVILDIRKKVATFAAVIALVSPLSANAATEQQIKLQENSQYADNLDVTDIDDDLWVDNIVDESGNMQDFPQTNEFSTEKNLVKETGVKVLNAFKNHKSAVICGAVVITATGKAGIMLLQKRNRSVKKKSFVKINAVTPPSVPTGEFDFDLLGESHSDDDWRDTMRADDAERKMANVHAAAVNSDSDQAAMELLSTYESKSVKFIDREVVAPTQSTPSSPEKLKKRMPQLGLRKLFSKSSKSSRPSTLQDALIAYKDCPLESLSIRLTDYLTLVSDASSERIDSDFEKDGEFDSDKAISELIDLMNLSSAASTEVSELIGNIVNAIVVSLVDKAITLIKNEEQCQESLKNLIKFMEYAGNAFGSLCPGIQLDPPLKYNGNGKRGQLENLYELYSRSIIIQNSSEMVAAQEQLRDLLNIRESKAKSIEQKVLMDMVQKMMQNGGSEEELAALLGGLEGESGIPNMPEGPEVAAQLEAFKAMVKDGNISREEVMDLRKMYKEMGMDIDKMVAESAAAEDSMGTEGKELYSLLQQMLAQHPL